MNIRFTAATPADEPDIRQLLEDAGLPHNEISGHLSFFITGKDSNTLVGCGGMEVLGQIALVRSLAVAEPYRGTGIGSKLYEFIERLAHVNGVHTLYLLTQTAEHFFLARGFRAIIRGDVPDPLRQTAQFSSLCPSSAVCMKKEIRQASG